jgi:hypothetical protein
MPRTNDSCEGNICRRDKPFDLILMYRLPLGKGKMASICVRAQFSRNSKRSKREKYLPDKCLRAIRKRLNGPRKKDPSCNFIVITFASVFEDLSTFFAMFHSPCTVDKKGLI